MHEDRIAALDEQGRRLHSAFVTVEAASPEVPRHRRRRTLVVVAAAVTAVVVASLIGGIGKGERRVGVRDALGDVARRIDIAPRPAPSQFLYTRTRSTATGVTPPGLDYRGRPYGQFVSAREHYQSSWLSISHNGRLLMRGGPPSFPTAADAAVGKRYYESLAWFLRNEKTLEGRRRMRPARLKLVRYNKARGLNGIMFPESFETVRGTMISNDRLVLGGELLTRAQVRKYPRDPAKIYARVRAEFVEQMRRDARFNASLPPKMRIPHGTNPDIDENVWGALSSSSGDLPAPQDLRSAVVRALAHLPGVEAAGEATDSRGRRGERFFWDHGGKRFSVLFDRKTSTVLQAQTVVTDPAKLKNAAFRHLPVGTKLATYELLEQRTLDRLPSPNRSRARD